MVGRDQRYTDSVGNPLPTPQEWFGGEFSAGVQVNFMTEQYINGLRFEPGLYRIVRLGPPEDSTF